MNKLKIEHIALGALVIGAAYYFWKTSAAAAPTAAPIATAPATTLPVIPQTQTAKVSASFVAADGHIFKDYVSADFFKSQPQKLTH